MPTLNCRFHMKELWADVVGYEGLYKISSFGRIMSLKRKKAKIMSLNYKSGYVRCILSKDNVKLTWLIHRLVYAAFVGVIPPKHQVHHVDGNKKNNRLENLMLLSTIEHCKETFANNPQMFHKSARTRTRKVLQYTAHGSFVAEYNSSKEAANSTGICQRNIQQVAAGELNQNGKVRMLAGGYYWRYKK